MNLFLIELNVLDFPILIGIFASILHVWAGPDHLAAVTPLVFDSKKGHWKIGAFWGIGHLTGMLMIGFLFYLFKDFIPIQSISSYSEQIVGVILIGLGIWSFLRIKSEHKHQHSHPHLHSDEFHDFVHVHEHQNHNHAHVVKIEQNLWAAMSVGIIHGFAGVSHFLLMLPALAFKTKWETGQYLIGFAIGTLVAMIVFSLIIGKFHHLKSQKHSHSVFKSLHFWGGIVAISIGLFWLFKN